LTHPNIIKIICHDIGKHLGCYGVKSVSTKAIDALAKNGILFENSYATSPGCSPSRAAIATGMYPHNNGVLGLAHAHFGWSLDKKVNHIAKHFFKNNYSSILFGLQHVTYNEKTLGFKKIFPERPADAVVKNIKENIDSNLFKKPFYAEINFFEPHRPFDFGGVKPFKSKGISVPKYIPNNHDTRKEFASMQGAIKKMDDSVAKIIKILKRKNLYENTIILFTTDHGIPFPRAKGTLYDAGIETSLIISYPKLKIKNKKFKELISNIDILPTLLDFAKIKIPKIIQGKSFYPLIMNKKYNQNKHIFAEKTYHDLFDPIRCIRDKNYKLIINFDSDKIIRVPGDVMMGPTYKTMLKQMINVRDRYELYHIKTDKFERKNLAQNIKYKKIRQNLLKKIAKWMQSTKDPLLNNHIKSPFLIDTLKDLK
jgi:N-sulfoglucosamine sulfohydrolase